MSRTKQLGSQIDPSEKDIVIKFEDGSQLDITSINVMDGNIVSVVTKDNMTIFPSSFNFYKEVLNVPGIGYITPGSRVIIDEKDYLLQFGWHTNISNQTIYSWYLVSLTEDIPPRTLYQEMIDKIEIVHFK